MPKDGRNPQTGQVKVVILKSTAGTYQLSHSPGDKVKLDKKQATELIASGHAKKIR